MTNTTTYTTTYTTNTHHACGLSPQAVSWVQEYGSDFLTFCVRKGVRCRDLYNQERVQKEAPDWQLLDEETYLPNRLPAEAMELLSRGREQFPKARLRQIFRDDRDEYVVVIDVPWPDGQKLIFNDIIVVKDDD